MSPFSTPLRVLIADSERHWSVQLKRFLKERGFDCKHSESGAETLKLIESWKPHFILYDMMLPQINALQLLDKIRQKTVTWTSDSTLMVTSHHNASANVRTCIQAGAQDFIVKPASNADILSRLAFHSQKRRQISETTKPQDTAQKRGDHCLHLTEMVLRKLSTQNLSESDVLFDLVQMLALATNAVRCSLVQTHADDYEGVVLKSSDDKNFSNFRLDLNKYPEIAVVMNSEKLVAIDNLAASGTMAKIRTEFKNISFNSMIVCPIWVNSSLFGVISCRMSEKSPKLTDSDIRFAQIIAHLSGLMLQSMESPSYSQAA